MQREVATLSRCAGGCTPHVCTRRSSLAGAVSRDTGPQRRPNSRAAESAVACRSSRRACRVADHERTKTDLHTSHLTRSVGCITKIARAHKDVLPQTLSERIGPGAGAAPAAQTSAAAAGLDGSSTISSKRLKFDPASPESPLNDFELANLDAVLAMGDALLDGDRVNSRTSGSLCDARDESNASGAQLRGWGEGEGRAFSENRELSTLTRRLPSDAMRPRSADDPYALTAAVCLLVKIVVVLLSFDRFGRYESMRNNDCKIRHMSAGAKQSVVPT